MPKRSLILLSPIQNLPSLPIDATTHLLTFSLAMYIDPQAHEWFSDNWHESVSCAIHAHVGSSYVCDPHRISGCGCLVYSFDDFGDGSFENAILK